MQFYIMFLFNDKNRDKLFKYVIAVIKKIRTSLRTLKGGKQNEVVCMHAMPIANTYG